MIEPHRFHRISPSTAKIIIWNGENPENIYPTIEKFTVPNELLEIAQSWRKLSAETGDKGCCVLGAGLHFTYQGNEYYMYPQSPWQGEGSWTPYVNYVKEQLEGIGATDIRYDWGIMD